VKCSEELGMTRDVFSMLCVLSTDLHQVSMSQCTLIMGSRIILLNSMIVARHLLEKCPLIYSDRYELT
jgi:hypothetical protein